MTLSGREALTSRELASLPCWPDGQQRLLLLAALGDIETAVRAWQDWDPEQRLRSVDFASYRLFPMVYANLTDIGYMDRHLARLAPVLDRTRQRNQRLMSAAQRVVDALGDAGIGVLMMKGALLVSGFYPDSALRPMGDIDLLVEFSNASRAVDVMYALGYETGYHVTRENMALRHSFDFTDRDDNGIDLHWYLLAECGAPQAQQTYWDHRTGYPHDGVDRFGLDPAAALFQVLVHGSRWDLLAPTQWPVDCHVLLMHATIDWARLLELATGNRLVLQVLAALEFYNRLVPGRVPGAIIDQLYAEAVSRDELAEFRLRTSRGNYARRLRVHWYSHKRNQRLNPGASPGFHRYLLSRWGLRSVRQLPRFILGELYHRRRNPVVLNDYAGLLGPIDTA